ncbi:helix-turn-helix domain-containing protein [Ramlibacter sp. MMS24-I3-19]|uniref:helix-turn-helix domain-containing protein n=1 Tax=Ramlibacter sp. MMS24-I3-19 TaxID=3416606 RepID=UPI003D016D84
MDSMIAAAARALSVGQPLLALDVVALRNDPHALALRRTAMAQLQQYERARALLQRAARAFGADEELARAKCTLAEAEVALLMRDLTWASGKLAGVAPIFERHHDQANLLHARLVEARRLLLLGRVAAAIDVMALVKDHGASPVPIALAELTRTELALRQWRAAAARQALGRAHAAAAASQNAMLLAEVSNAGAPLERTAARLITGRSSSPVRLEEVEALLGSNMLVLDGCRRGVAWSGTWRSLARRPVLFTLAHALASSWPDDVDRESLIVTAFRTRRPDHTHRARLRVEIGRLRSLIKGMAEIVSTPRGFVLRPAPSAQVAVLEPPIDGQEGALIALLSDGSRWSTSGLAEALGASQRTVQRALSGLMEAGRVQGVGNGMARRWQASPLTDFTTILLLPTSLAGP